MVPNLIEREWIPMPYVLNLIYLFVLLLLAPWLVYKAIATGKYRRGFSAKFLGRIPPTRPPHPRPLSPKDREEYCVWFHGVSVGEIHLLRQVVAQYRRRFPDWQCVVSTTTATGFDEARHVRVMRRCTIVGDKPF